MKLMDKNIVAIFAIIISSASVLSQDNNEIKEISIDFSKKSINTKAIDDIAIGEYYRLTIEGVNMNLYKIEVNNSDTTYSKPLETPTFASLEIDAITKAIGGLSDLTTSVTKSRNTLIDGLENTNYLIQQLPNTLSLDDKEYEKLIALINRENENLKNLNARFNEITIILDNLEIDICLFRLNALRTNANTKSFNFQEAIETCLDIRKELVLLVAAAQENNNVFKNNFSEYSEALQKKDDIKNAVASLEDAYGKLSTTLNKALTELNAEKVNELLSQIIFLEENSENKYTSLPFQFNGEQAILDYKIIPRDSKYLLQTYSSKIIFPKVNPTYVNVGLSFYGSNLVDEAYSVLGTQNADSTITYKNTKEDDLKAEIGIASLFRYGSKVCDSRLFGVHFNFGPGISISKKIKPRLLVGGGISLGRIHNISLDFGLITGYVDVKSKTVEEDTEYIIEPENVTVSSLKAGGYLSLGYYYKF